MKSLDKITVGSIIKGDEFDMMEDNFKMFLVFLWIKEIWMVCEFFRRVYVMFLYNLFSVCDSGFNFFRVWLVDSKYF